MAEHNGLPVSGYQPQSSEKIALVNEFKADEERLLRKLDALLAANMATSPYHAGPYDGRFIAIARTHFQLGFMALNRAVFQPGRVTLPEDNQEDGKAA